MIFTQEFKHLMGERYDYLSNKLSYIASLVRILRECINDISEGARQTYKDRVNEIKEQHLYDFADFERYINSNLNEEQKSLIREVILDNYLDPNKDIVSNRDMAIEAENFFTTNYYLIIQQTELSFQLHDHPTEDNF